MRQANLFSKTWTPPPAALKVASRPGLNRPAGPGVLSLDPYPGACPFGCCYCPEPGGETGPTGVSAAAPGRWVGGQWRRKLLRALERRPGQVALRLGGAGEPYPHAERAEGATREILEALAQMSGARVTIATQSDLIVRDVDVLEQIAWRHELSIQVRLISLDAVLMHLLEPKAPAPRERLRAIRRLAKSGLKVGLNVTPALPGITDSNEGLEGLIAAARSSGVGDLSWGVLRLPEAVRTRFFGFLQEHFPHLSVPYEKLYLESPRVSRGYGAALGARVEGLKAKYGLPAKTAAGQIRRVG